MIRINLLPPDERQPELPLGRICLLVGLLVSVILFSIYGYGMYTIADMERQIHDTRIQYELLRPTQEKMLATSTQQQLINTKNNLLVMLTKERKSWHAIMTHFGVVITPNVWLTEIGLADKNALRIKGVAASYPELASFVKKVEQDDWLSEATLVNSENNPSLNATGFELLVKIKGM